MLIDERNGYEWEEGREAESRVAVPLNSVDECSAAAADADTDIEGEDPYFSRAVGKSFQMLNLLSLADQPLTLNQMISQAELTKSSRLSSSAYAGAP